VDARTGEPIASANVVILGTPYGAATSLDGEFYIMNLQPGQYTVKVSYLGYVSITQEDVIVYADFTTTLDFSLESSVIEGQEVTVKAPRKVLRHDATATTKLTTGDEMYNMPVATYVGALANVGGAVGGGANIHIRGGRRGEVAYLIDGMEVKDPMNNLRMLNVGSPAVAEMIVLTGGFDAEYGNAQSAIVNVVTKEGSKEYHGKLKYLCDDLSSTPAKFENYTTHFDVLDTTVTTRYQPPSSYQNYDRFEGSLGGPEPITQYLLPMIGLKIPGSLTFFAAADLTGRNTNGSGVRINSSEWYNHNMLGGLALDENRAQAFMNNNFQLTYQMNPKMKLKAAYRSTREWYNVYTMRQSRNFPYDEFTQKDINRTYQSWTGNDSTYNYVFEKFNPDGLNPDDDGDGLIDEEVLNGIDDDLDGRIDEDLQWYEYNAADHIPTRRIEDDQIILGWDQTLSKSTYYNLKLSRYKASRKMTVGDKSPADYGEFKEEYTDLPGPDGKYNGRYDSGEPFVDTDGDGTWDKGNPSNLYNNYEGFLVSGDGTEGNVGQPVPLWLNEESYVWAAKFQITSQFHQNHQLRSGVDMNYFDLALVKLPYPNIDNNGAGIYTDIYKVFPNDGAAYVQDKMEFKDVTFNLGLRFDYYMPGEQVQECTALDTTVADRNNYVPFKIPEKFKAFVSPRLGVSYAITENAYLHAHYGHFYQRPAWDNLFESVNQVRTGGTPGIGNPDLDPEKTVSYELGVSWNPYGSYLVDVTGFTKDVKNWINTRQGKYWYPENFGKPLIGQNYAIYDNQDYAFSRGVEFNVSKEYGSNWSGRVTYTLSWANAKNSYNISTEAIRGNYVEPPLALPAGWDQRHSIVANLGLQYGPHQPLLGINGAPGDWQFNLIWSARSGLPYTPTDASSTLIEGKYMSERTPWTYVADLNATKYFSIGKWRTSIWLEVRNLFDQRNIQNVDDYYGRVGAPEAFDSYTGEAGWVNDRSSPNDPLDPFAGPNPEAWSNPRYIRIGLGLDF
jgi:outer membrane receptor protein involved in Fe transport